VVQQNKSIPKLSIKLRSALLEIIDAKHFGDEVSKDLVVTVESSLKAMDDMVYLCVCIGEDGVP
jgi:hypothetical protein